YCQLATASAQRALELAEERKRVGRPNARDYVRAHWLLGAAHRANGNLPQSERHLTEAVTRCRRINAVDAEADILLDLARLRRDQAALTPSPAPTLALTPSPSPDFGRGGEAVRLAEEALLITERSGYALQGADVHLFLAELALAPTPGPSPDFRGGVKEARSHAQAALQLAACDGPPDYTYKAAYEEVQALLARLDV
ncbi:MAG: hypothetical protein U9O54_07295, partial [Chloroflexota bacterium]|nr:hypothetical protein [Chloroflexota bacterium]